MQGKGIVKFFFAALVVVCLYQLSFTWKSAQIEKKAVKIGEASAASSGIRDIDSLNRYRLSVTQRYIDSLANEEVYNLLITKYTYDEVRERQLNLGLDLQGGMSVVLEVSKYDLIKSLSNNPKNPKLIAAIDLAREKEGRGEGDFIDLFRDSYQELYPDAKMVSLFTTRDNTEELSKVAGNNEVTEYIREKSDEGIESTYTKLRQRIDNFGVAQPYLTLQKSTGRIIVELPGVDNPKQVKKLLQSTANLEFWEAYKLLEISDNLTRANDKLRNIFAATQGDTLSQPYISEDDQLALPSAEDLEIPTIAAPDVTDVVPDEETIEDPLADIVDPLAEEDPEVSIDDELNLDDISAEDILEDESSDLLSDDRGPLFNPLLPPSRADGPVIGYVNIRDTGTVMRYLNREEISVEFPFTKFLWSANPTPDDQSLFELYAMKMNVDNDRPLLEGDIIKNAAQGYDQVGRANISMSMKSMAAKSWKRITGDNIGEHIAIVLDDRVYSAPVINGEIPGGNSEISGNFSIKEAQALASILETGKLPVPSKVVQEDQVGPSLGAESVRTGVISLLAGLVFVLIFMLVYYNTAGIVADLALLANIFFVFGVLASLQATLTLPGIAGIVLTVGMAVDANVIIFERIREELAKGKSVLKAIADGYQHSYSAIIDANITTLIVAIILFNFGMGPVLGFATVLMIGIFSSMFTAILVTRLVFDWFLNRNIEVKYYNSITEGAFRNIKFDFIAKRKTAYVFSGSLIAIGIISFIFNGFTLGVDFKGGRTYTVSFEDKISAELVRNELQTNFDESIIVKSFASDNKLKITTSHRVDETAPETDSLVSRELFASLANFYSPDVASDYNKWEANFKESQQKVEPTIAKDIKTSSIWALIIALAAIFAYIVLRFRKWQFGLGAVVAVFHDVVIVLTVFSLFRNIMPFSLEIGETFIAAILTVIGYSINDTVVVFDRVREYLRESKAGDFKSIINSAVQSTLSRTLITSFTTLIVVFLLFLFGTELIKGFAFAILIGILIGTYSSIFIATPIVVDLSKDEDRKRVASSVSSGSKRRKRKVSE